MNQLKFSFLFFIAVILLSVGCTEEDLSVCNADVYLKIGFLNETKSHSSIDTITVFIYEGTPNVLVDQYSTPFQEVLANDSLIRIDLPKFGTYNFVVLADASADYFHYESIDSFEDKSLTLDDRGQSEINWPIGNIYHGLVAEAEIAYEQSRVFDVTLTQNNKDIYIKYTGLESLDHMSDLRIDYNNKVINSFNNRPLASLTDDCLISYTPVVTPSSRASVEEHDFRFNTLRLFSGDKMNMHYTLPGTDGVEKNHYLNLLSIIQLNPKYRTQLDLDKEYQFFLDLNFDILKGELTLVSVTVNDWKVIIVKPEV